MEHNNRNIIQSYIMTVARNKFSVNEKRIVYLILERAQQEVEGHLIKGSISLIHHNLRSVSLEIPFSAIIDVISSEEKSYKNYENIKKAARSLSRKFLEWEDVDNKTYYETGLVINLQIKKSDGIMRFDIANWVWDCMLDFSKGFRKFDLFSAMKLKSPYSMRMYELFSRQSNPLTYTVDELKKMFCVEGKYKDTSKFRKRIIEPSKRELDESAPYSFNYEENKVGKGKTARIISYTFYPVFYPERQDKALLMKEKRAKLSTRSQIESNVYDYLIHTYRFEPIEITRNKQIIIEAQEQIKELVSFLAKVWESARTRNNPKGYVIGAIKNKLSELKVSPALSMKTNLSKQQGKEINNKSLFHSTKTSPPSAFHSDEEMMQVATDIGMTIEEFTQKGNYKKVPGGWEW